MIAPAAHTFKGLAKAFVSSAGGKGPESPSYSLRPLFLLCPEKNRPTWPSSVREPFGIGEGTEESGPAPPVYNPQESSSDFM
jgi:hypothetical protein